MPVLLVRWREPATARVKITEDPEQNPGSGGNEQVRFEMQPSPYLGTTRSRLAERNRLAVLLTCCAIGACKVVESAPPSHPTLNGRIEFSVGGGFAGVRQGLTIDDAGVIDAHDEKRGTTVRAQLAPERLAAIRAAFQKIEPDAAVAHPPGARCADCFRYSIRATVGGRSHAVAVSSVTVQASHYGEIVSALAQILRETLSRTKNVNE
jgi:hypothetical protein